MTTVDLWRNGFKNPRYLLQNWDDMFRDVDRMLGAVTGSATPTVRRAGFRPACDIIEQEQSYELSFDLPGIPSSEVAIELDGNELVVTGERKSEQDGGKEGARYFERSYGRFERRFTLPENVDLEGIAADFTNGVLKISVPKVERQNRRTIPIGGQRGESVELKNVAGKKEAQAS